MSETHYRKLERMYHDSPVGETIETELTVGDGAATVEVPVKERYHHALSGVHGAVYFKALDDAAFFAANSVVEDVFVLTTDFNLYFERPVSAGTIRAEGELVNENPEQLIAESVAYDDDGNELARGSGTFRKSDVALTPDIGYE
ncbi:PaaI family thioesterase [Halorientalis litorea]|uniref:PaaI family thioesterase n=1 Tax=Halorientalis litorea TaxID=2931977 RepID=UPI001FF11724|nr:PaaI family thioesterase [Halorientalis litorea]